MIENVPRQQSEYHDVRVRDPHRRTTLRMIITLVLFEVLNVLGTHYLMPANPNFARQVAMALLASFAAIGIMQGIVDSTVAERVLQSRGQYANTREWLWAKSAVIVGVSIMFVAVLAVAWFCTK